MFECGDSVARLVPALASRLGRPPATAHESSESERYVLFRAIEGLLGAACADGSVVLVLEDLHWAELPTLKLLRRLLTSPRSQRLVVLATCRVVDLPDEHPLRDLLVDLHREPHVLRINLAGLETADVAELLRGISDQPLETADDRLARALEAGTNGNPFFITELVRDMVESGTVINADGQWQLTAGADVGAQLPVSIAETLAGRVRRMRGPVQQCLRVAAVLGEEFDFDLLSELIDDPAAGDALDEAVRDAVLIEVPGQATRFRFSHALMQRYLYRELGAARRAALHGQIGLALQRRARAGRSPAAVVARHLIAAGDLGLPDALAYAARAGDEALEKLAPDDARRWYEVSLELLTRIRASDDAQECGLLVKRGEAERQAGDPRFRETLLEAAAIAQRIGDDAGLVRAALANTRGMQSETGVVDQERIATLDAALRVVGPGDGAARARLLAMEAAELMYSGEWERRVSVSDEALATARRLHDPDALIAVLNMRFVTLLAPETLPERSANTVDAVAVAERLDDPVDRFFAYHWRSYACIEEGDIAGARSWAARERELADRFRQPTTLWLADADEANLAIVAGELEAAAELAAAALETGRQSEPDALACFAAQQTSIAFELGRLRELTGLLEQAIEENPGVPGFQATLALALTEDGRERDARALLDQAAASSFNVLPYDVTWLAVACIYAHVASELGAVEAAETLYELLAPWHRQIAFPAFGVWGPVGAVSRLAGGHARRAWGGRTLPFRGGGVRRADRCAGLGGSGRAAARATAREGTVSGPGQTRTGRPIRVAILGGGCGGLAAAWALSATPELRERFEVTVHQRGWQLGGKGASGRNPHPGGGPHGGQRIEEHGLHIWFGFYEHAFRMLRQAYAEAGLADGEDWWTVPFQKCHSVSLFERREDDTWVRQLVSLPPRGGSRRGPPIDPVRAPLGRVLARTIRLLAAGLRSDLAAGGSARGGSGDASDPELDATVSTLQGIADELDRLPSPLTVDGGELPPEIWRGNAGVGARPVQRVRNAAIEPLLEALSEQVRGLRRAVGGRAISDRVRLWRGVLELVSATLTGIVRDDILWRGFAVLDEYDLRAWLGRHGASEETLDRSPVLRGLYDLTFAYRGGDKRRPSLAAGKGLQSLLMMVNYDGAFMWRMRAGMGDAVFAPLYLALLRRGVRFRFFSRITGLGLMPGRPLVDSIELVREAAIAAGPDHYQPLVSIEGWWCWPAAPDSGQLTGAEAIPERLARGVDFDDVVLAIPVGALGEICPELAAASPRFRRMLDGCETVRTKAFQVWLTKSIGQLRERSGGDELDPPSTAYAEPFDTYCDMSHLLGAEAYEGVDGPKSVAYFCAVLPDELDGSTPEEAVRATAREHLEQRAAAFWPGAFTDGRFDWDVLFDPVGRTGPDRLQAQYFRANVAATDRYVTTAAGTVDSRLDPEQSGFQNLALAGDWTHSGIDGGCVEAAVISGERAAARSDRPARGRRTRARAGGPLCRLRRVGHGAGAAAVRARPAVLLLRCGRPCPRPGALRPGAQAAHRRCAALPRPAAGARDPHVRGDRGSALAAPGARGKGERVRAGGRDLGAGGRTASRGRPLRRRPPDDLHALHLGRRPDRVRVRPRGVRLRKDPGVDAPAPRPARGSPGRRWAARSASGAGARRLRRRRVWAGVRARAHPADHDRGVRGPQGRWP